MIAEFPEPESTFYVLETHRLDGGSTATVFAAGPYETPDAAKTAREQLHSAAPGRNLHCAEYRTYE